MPHDEKTPLPATLQALFLQEWYRDRADGITPRSTHDMLSRHIEKDETFQGSMVQRVATLEAGAERDAEDRMINGTGRHIIPPPPPIPRELKKSGRPWWSRPPFKGIIEKGGLALLGAIAGWLLRHFAFHP